jgi:hypothetical protein
LLEEPLAAFYAWIEQSAGNWRQEIKPGEVILVCDVGGGTTDFTLIAVHQAGGELKLERISVGEHILLGGDNMDLALAHRLKAKFEERGARLDRWQFLALVQSARKAKEELFKESGPSETPVVVSGRGSSLFASTLSQSLSREEVEQVISDGFFPWGPVEQPLEEGIAMGLQEIGLPYASDPAITRHLGRFLCASLERVKSGDFSLDRSCLEQWQARGFLAPTRVLFNGGVFCAVPLRERLRAVLSEWCGKEIRELQGSDLNLAVARGAAVYGRLKISGQGLRVKAATLHSFYLGVESSAPAVPGIPASLSALCIAPQGMEEGSRMDLAGRQFGLVTGQPVRFRFYSSDHRSQDETGMLLPETEGLVESNSLELSLPAQSGKREIIPVSLETCLSELGVIEIWMKSVRSDAKWKLEFNLRSKLTGKKTSAPLDLGVEAARVRRALQQIEEFYGRAKAEPAGGNPKELFSGLEETLGLKRQDFGLGLLRTLWGPLAKGLTKRGRSLAHEITWLYLAGFILRPGYGTEMDRYRIAELWRAWELGLFFPKALQAETQWWIMWRRVCGGLNAEQQTAIWNTIWPRIAGSADASPELVRLAASFERVSLERRQELATLCLERIGRGSGSAKEHYFWALGRLGSRVPLYAGWEAVLSPRIVEQWFSNFSAGDWRTSPLSGCSLMFSLAGRSVGVPALDINEEVRLRILQKLRAGGAEAAQVAMVEQVVPVSSADRSTLFGEELPAGLVLTDH